METFLKEAIGEVVHIVTTRHSLSGTEGRRRYNSNPFVGTTRLWVVITMLCQLYPKKGRYPLWVVDRAGVYGTENVTQPGLEPRTFYPTASRYTVNTIRAT